jgi:cytochrome P450
MSCCCNPEQWQLLVDDPTLVPEAIEELLRYVSPAHTANRRSLVDTEIEGVPVQVDETVIGLLSAANRDPAVFSDPDRLDVRRPESKKHLTFSFGPHFCLGSSLARAEGRIVLTKLVERFPGMQLATDTVEWDGPASLGKLRTLPVTLGHKHRSLTPKMGAGIVAGVCLRASKQR